MSTTISPNLHLWLTVLKDLNSDLVPDFVMTSELFYGQHDECDPEWDSCGFNERAILEYSEALRLIGGYSTPTSLEGVALDEFEPAVSLFTEILGVSLTENVVTHGGEWHEERIPFQLAQTHLPQWWWTCPTFVDPIGVPNTSSYMYGRRLASSFRYLANRSHDLFLEEDYVESVASRLSFSAGVPLARPEQILRIGSQSDYVSLVESCPRRVENESGEWAYMEPGYFPEAVPDWNALAGDYDAVVLDADAYVRYAWIPAETSYGTTWLSGWVPEAIYRLR